MVIVVEIPLSFTDLAHDPFNPPAGHGSSDWESTPLHKAVLQLLSPLLAPLYSSRQEIPVIRAQNFVIKLLFSYYFPDVD